MATMGLEGCILEYLKHETVHEFYFSDLFPCKIVYSNFQLRVKIVEGVKALNRTCELK